MLLLILLIIGPEIRQHHSHFQIRQGSQITRLIPSYLSNISPRASTQGQNLGLLQRSFLIPTLFQISSVLSRRSLFTSYNSCHSSYLSPNILSHSSRYLKSFRLSLACCTSQKAYEHNMCSPQYLQTNTSLTVKVNNALPDPFNPLAGYLCL